MTDPDNYFGSIIRAAEPMRDRPTYEVKALPGGARLLHPAAWRGASPGRRPTGSLATPACKRHEHISGHATKYDEAGP